MAAPRWEHVALAITLWVAVPAAARPPATVSTPAPTKISAAPAAMTLDQAIDFALAHNTGVLAARASALAAGSELARSRELELPTVSGTAQSVLQKQSTNNSGSLAQFGLQPSATFSQNTTGLQGSANILNLLTALEAKRAKRSYDAAQENFRLVRQQTVVSVETSYFTLVQSATLSTLAEYDTAYQRALRDIAETNFTTGKVAGIDRLKAQVQLGSSQQRLASARADAEDARENLAQNIGADQSQHFVIETDIPVPPPPKLDRPALESVALTNRPEIAIAQANLENARISNALVDAPNRPSVALTGGWGDQVSPTANALNFNQCIATNMHLPPGIPPVNCSPGASHFYNVGLTSVWNLPLLDWGANHAAHGSAYASIDAMRAALSAARRQAQIDVDQAARRVEVQRDNLALATASIDIAKQVAQTAQVQYRVGLISQIDVTASEQTYLQAVKDKLIAQIGYVMAVEKLKLATGTL